MSRSGACMCGAVSYEISGDVSEAGACHCAMCRRWTGGIYLSFRAPADQVMIHGTENIGAYTSSPWAERAFCKICGSSLYYRVTADGPYQGYHHFAAGTLDDTSNLSLTSQVYIDLKPDYYAFQQKTRDMTEAEVMAMFADVTEPE